MKLLVLGGSVFLSRAVAEEAVERGHDVTCACRGESGSVPDGATHVTWDRADPTPPELVETDFDAVVDVARIPSWVRNAVSAHPDAHWVFVSTINVYPDNGTPGGSPATLAVHEPMTTDEDPSASSEAYGAMKVACEQLVQGGTVSSTVIRPGLIVGPGDPTGRFSYWPDRIGDGGEVLAPGTPDDPVQLIDVRDLAAWIVESAEQRRTGTFDGIGPRLTRGELLEQVIEGCALLDRLDALLDEVERSVAGEAEPSLTWVPQEFLQEHEVEPWAGPKGIPLWLPLPEYDGMLAHDPTPSFDAGLTTRPIAETARDTLAWLREESDPTLTGLSREGEADVLRAWHTLHA
jgi:2'-hydroxyisoflavone reductase